MMRISSSPNSPFSPQCGFSAATPIRGGSYPMARSVESASRNAFSIRSGVIMFDGLAQRDVRRDAERRELRE